MKFKKTVLTILCVVLCLSAFGCGSKNNGGDNKKDSAQQTEQTEQNGAKDEQNKDGDKKDNGSSDNKSSDNSGASADSGQAPVIESGEELKSMVDEFNNTDDPEKKEELRKKLEAFLNQAEQQSAASATENNDNK